MEQVTLAGAADESEPLKAARAPLAAPAAKADRTPKASGFRIFQDEKSNATPTKAEATLQAKRNGGRRPLSLTPNFEDGSCEMCWGRAPQDDDLADADMGCYGSCGLLHPKPAAVPPAVVGET